MSILGTFDATMPAAYTNVFPVGTFGRFTCATFSVDLTKVCNPYTSYYQPTFNPLLFPSSCQCKVRCRTP